MIKLMEARRNPAEIGDVSAGRRAETSIFGANLVQSHPIANNPTQTPVAQDFRRILLAPTSCRGVALLARRIEGMEPVRVALDTSIFRRDPRFRSGALEALSRLAEARYVRILIPDIVAREFTSLPADKAQALAGVRKALTDLRRSMPDDFTTVIEQFQNNIAEEFHRIEAEAAALFKTWVDRTGADMIAPGSGHAERVLAKYFDGALPFKSRKSRADFPDAFIVEVLADLATDDELVVVTADLRMAEALMSSPHITVFSDLKSLLESEIFGELRTEVATSNVPHVLAYLQQQKIGYDDDIEKGITQALAGRQVRYYSGDDEDDRGESLFIEQIGRLVEWSIDTDGAEYLGEGVLSMSFGATIEVDLEQPSDAWRYAPDEYIGSSPMEAVLEVIGACSLIVQRGDLEDPSATSKLDDIMERTRVEVDDLDEVTITMTDRERW